MEYKNYKKYINYKNYINNVKIVAKINPNTTILISRETKSLLDSVGSKGDSYEDIIKRLYVFYTKKDKKQSKRKVLYI